MDIKVVCMGKGSIVKSISGGEVVVYSVDFAVCREDNPHNQKFYGSIHFESSEPFDYKETQEYDLKLSGLISLVKPGDAKIAGIIH